MAKFLNTKSIYYNDVNLIASPATIEHRSSIPIELNRVIISPMSAVVGAEFALEALKLGLTVCLHKFCDVNETVNLYGNLKFQNTFAANDRLFVSVGLNDNDRIINTAKLGASNYLIDCANGYLPQIKTTINYLLDNVPIQSLIVGNVMTRQGISLYKEYSGKIPMGLSIRVGIAGGAACSTSDITGFNRGQITELIETSEEADLWDFNVIADGGIKNGNYAAKAFGCGAQYVMLGGYFARAIQAYTHIIKDGTFWGGASHKQQELYGGIRRHSEGKIFTIPKEEIRPLNELVDDLWGGLASAVSYSGYKTLTEFIGNGTFEIKENSLPPKSR